MNESMNMALPDEIEDLIRRTVAALPKIVLGRLLAYTEPTKDTFLVRPGSVAAIIRAIRKMGPDDLACFKSPKGRTDFLYAALRHLASIRNHEELIVAYGRRRYAARNAPAQLQGMWRGIGSRHAVALTPKVQHVIGQYSKMDRSEIVIVHNHPANDVKGLITLLCGWKPLPSSQDRELALQANVRAFVQMLRGIGGASIRCYLVDEGRLSEFYLPSLEQIIQVMDSLIGKWA